MSESGRHQELPLLADCRDSLDSLETLSATAPACEADYPALATHGRRSRLEEADIAVCALWSPAKPHGKYDGEIDFAAVEVSSNLTSVAVETIAGRIFTFRDQ